MMRFIVLFCLIGFAYAQSNLVSKLPDNEISAKAQQASFDRLKQIYNLSGNVEIQHKDIRLYADNVTVERVKSTGSTSSTAGERDHYLVVLVSSGLKATSSNALPDRSKQVFFRQENDATKLITEGYANKMVYNTQSQIMELIGKARVRRLAKGKIIEDASGEAIIYNHVSEFLTIKNKENSQDKSNERVQILIKPSAKQ